jgi:hypothetical protein
MKSTSKEKSKSKSTKSSKSKLKSSDTSFLNKILLNARSNRNVNKKPIDDLKLSIREMKHTDKYELFKIVSDFRHSYYINVYKTVFRSWFTYGITILFLGLSLTFINSKTSAFFLPPVIMSLLLLWKVTRYKKLNRSFNVNEMEALNQTESFFHKYKSTEQRRTNQGVLLIFIKEDKLIDCDFDLDNLNESDLNTTSSEDEGGSLDIDKHKKLIGYLIYNKQKDELETVTIKEICIHIDYRERKVASNFLRRVCLNVFRPYGYRRVTFQVSNLDIDINDILERKKNLFNKIYSWVAYNFVPGVVDERTVYSFDISKIINEKF